MSFDEVSSVIKGNVVAKPLISLWRHYPGIDLDVEKLVEATVKDYHNHPSDLIKLSPHGRYCVVDFGCEISPGSTKYGDTGASSCKKCAVEYISDWSLIKEIDPLDGHYGEQLKFIQEVRKEFPNTPIMATIFTPTMVARKLSGNKMPEHFFSQNNDNSIVKNAIHIINKVTSEFATACIDAGANGIFAALQEADRGISKNEEELNQLINLNKSFMNIINRKSEFTVLHLHGDDISFEYAIKLLKPTAVNWHDKTGWPNLKDARKIFSGGLLGGLVPEKVLEGDINDSIRHAYDLKNELPLILAPGCVLLQGTKEETLTYIFKKYKK